MRWLERVVKEMVVVVVKKGGCGGRVGFKVKLRDSEVDYRLLTVGAIRVGQVQSNVVSTSSPIKRLLIQVY